MFQIDPNYTPSPYYTGLTPHHNRSTAISIDDLFESFGGSWSIHRRGSKYKFIFGMRLADNSKYDSHHYIEYFDTSLSHRIRYDHYYGHKTFCTLLTKPEKKFEVGDDEFWDQYANQLELLNLTFESIELKHKNNSHKSRVDLFAGLHLINRENSRIIIK